MSLDEYNVKRAHSAIDDLAMELAQAKKELAEQRMLMTGKLMPVTEYPIENIMVNVKSYQSPEKARQEIEATYHLLLALRFVNQDAIRNNRMIYENLLKLIISTGIASSHTRIINKKTRKVNSMPVNWAKMLQSVIPMEDRWNLVQNVFDVKMKDVVDWEDQIAEEKKKQLEAAEQEEEKMKWNKQLAVLANKYGLPITADENEILETILSRDKYLLLGDALIRNRLDWSDGPSLVRNELEHFVVCDDIDKAIYANLSDCVNNWDGDGRVFRDCEYNYNRLFSMVDESLLNDYKMLTQKTESR